MIISIDTAQPLTEKDIVLLAVLLDRNDWPQVDPPAAEQAKAVKKAAAKKPAKKAEPKPEPEVEEDFSELRDKAVEAARDLLDAGEREKVMAALKDLSVGRVSDLPDESLQAFLDSLA